MAKKKATPTSISFTEEDRKYLRKLQRENTIDGKKPTKSAAIRIALRKATAQKGAINGH